MSLWTPWLSRFCFLLCPVRLTPTSQNYGENIHDTGWPCESPQPCSCRRVGIPCLLNRKVVMTIDGSLSEHHHHECADGWLFPSCSLRGTSGPGGGGGGTVATRPATEQGALRVPLVSSHARDVPRLFPLLPSLPAPTGFQRQGGVLQPDSGKLSAAF